MGGFFGPTGGGGIKPTANSPYTRIAPYPDAANKTNWAWGVIGDSLVIAGGSDSSTHYSTTTTSAFDTTTNTTTALAPMPLATDSSGAAIVNGKLYVVCGESYVSGSLTLLNTLYIYDPSTNTWQTGATSPAGYVKSPACVAIPGDGAQVLLMIGGYQYSTPTSGPVGPVANAYIYHPSTNTWQQVASAPGGLDDSPAFYLNNRVYVIATWYQNSQYVYDPTLNAWSSTNISRSLLVHAPSLVLYGSTVYIMSVIGNLEGVIAYDYSTAVAGPVLTPFAPAGYDLLASIGGTIYMTGQDGYIWSYDPTKDTGSLWSQLADTPIDAYHYLAAGYGMDADIAYLIALSQYSQSTYPPVLFRLSAGAWSQENIPVYIYQSPSSCITSGAIFAVGVNLNNGTIDLFRYDTTSHSWTDLGAIPPGLVILQIMGVVGDVVIHAGGENLNTGSGITGVYAYDITTGTWSTRSSMPYSVYGAASAVYESTLLVLGGQASVSYGPMLAYDASTDTWTERNHVDALGLTQLGQATNQTVGFTVFSDYGLLASPPGYCVYVYDIKKDVWTVQVALPISTGAQTPAWVDSSGRAILSVIPGINSSNGSTFSYEAFTKGGGGLSQWVGRDFR